jgi:tetratricopeptide (TPR) repeat protein
MFDRHATVRRRQEDRMDVVRMTLTALCALAAPLAIAAHGTQPPSGAAQLQIADAMFSEGRYAEARDAYRHALGADDGEVATRAATGLVRSLLRVGDFVLASRETHELRAAKPADAAIAALHGETLWASGLFEQAEAAFQEALARDPAHARARNGMARSLGAQSRLNEAVAAAEETVRLDPREADFHFNLGYLYERMGRFDAAANAYAQYVERLPNRDRNDQATAARLHIRFLQSFSNRRPMDMGAFDETRTWTVPIAIRDEKVFVRLRINGGSHDFVLDTGAEQTAISRDVARRQGIVPISYMRAAGVGESGVRGLQAGRIDSLQIGDLTIRDVPCAIKNPPLGRLPRKEADAFSPLALGLSMRVDYARRRLVLARTLPPAPYTHRLPLRMHRLPVVGGTLNGTLPAAFAIDTGGEVISIGHAIAGLIAHNRPFRRIPLKVFGTSGWDKDAFLMPNVNLELSTLRFNRIPVVVLDLRAPSALLGFQLGGTLGHKFLSKYTVSIDLARRVVELD